MSSERRGFVTILAIILVIGLLSNEALLVVADSSYRKPPFNGSIFGKRSSNRNSNPNNVNNGNAGEYFGEELFDNQSWLTHFVSMFRVHRLREWQQSIVGNVRNRSGRLSIVVSAGQKIVLFVECCKMWEKLTTTRKKNTLICNTTRITPHPRHYYNNISIND